MDGEARRGAKASFLLPRRGGAVVERSGVRQSARGGALFNRSASGSLEPYDRATMGPCHRGIVEPRAGVSRLDGVMVKYLAR